MDVPPVGEVLPDVLLGAGEEDPRVLGLHGQHLDVHLGPGEGPQHRQLRALYVQAQVVNSDPRPRGGQQEAVQGEALHLVRVLPGLGDNPRHAAGKC